MNSRKAFEDYHAANPVVYDTMVSIARDVIRRTGMEHIGAQALLEWTRYHLTVTVQSGDEYKINNDFASYYSRLIAINEPDLRNAFEFRRADEPDKWALELLDKIEHGQQP